jgi:hypothetical protein
MTLSRARRRHYLKWSRSECPKTQMRFYILIAVVRCLTSQSFWSIMAHNLTYEPKAPSIPSAGSRSLRPPPRSAPLLPLMPRSVLTFGHPKPRVEFSRQHKAYRFPLMQLPTELRVMIAKFALHHPECLEWVERTTGKVLKGQLYVVTTAMATTLTNSTLLLGCASCSIRRFEDLLLMPMSYASASIQCISIVFPEDAWTDWTEGISISEPSKRLWISCRRAFPKAQPHSSMACRSQTSPTHISRAIGESSLRWSVV